MTLKKYRVPALLLAALTAVVMTFAMVVTVQSAYADDEYNVAIYKCNDAVPGDIMEPEVVVTKGGKQIDPAAEGMHIEWYLGDFSTGDIKAKYIVRNDTDENRNKDIDPYIQVLSDDTTKARIEFNPDETVDDLYGLGFGMEAVLLKGETVISRSDSSQFLLSNEFNNVQYEYDPEFDPNILSGNTQDITVRVTHHEKGKKPVPLPIRCAWTTDNDGVQILHSGKAADPETIWTDAVRFTFKRVNSIKETEVCLTITDKSGNVIDSLYFPFYAITNNLADYQIEFNGNAEDPFVFVDKSDLPITKDSTACKITVVSGNGDGHVVPPEYYDLKIQKVIGYNEATWDEILQDTNFPLDVDPAGSSSINGDRTEGTAQYLITAVAKSGSGYTGQTGSGTGRFWLLDRKTLTWPAVSAGFPDKNYNIYHFRYEVKKGKKLTPFATSVETLQNLTQNKDYAVTYINKKTNKVYSSFPTKLGEYKVVFSGLSPYYGQQDGIDLLIGKKNTMKAKGKTIICKTAMKKGKTKKTKSFKASRAVSVTKAKGTVSYSKISGNKNITVSDSGKIKVKKGTKKGTYKVKIEVTAQGTSTYIAGTKKVTVKIKVK